MSKRYNKLNTFLYKEILKDKFGDKYDLSKVEYVNNKTKICLICPIHGEFWVYPYNVLRSRGCPMCFKENLSNIMKDYYESKENTINNDFLKERADNFIKYAINLFGDNFDYSMINYINMITPVKIKCNTCGTIFQQTPIVHLNGQGCLECAKKQKEIKHKKWTTETYVAECKKIHKIDYDYSKLEYTSLKNKIHVICYKHGVFYPFACNFLRGCECQKCMAEINSSKRLKQLCDFITEAKIIHKDDYDYSEFEYKGCKTKSWIKCNKCGYKFLQSPNDHLRGRGCPHCHFSNLESQMEHALQNNEKEYVIQKRIGKQSLDFYLPKHNIAIECQGEQHFKEKFTRKGYDVNFNFEESLSRDIRKFKKCQEKGVKLLYYTKLEWLPKNIFENPLFQGIYTNENTFTDINDLLNNICN